MLPARGVACGVAALSLEVLVDNEADVPIVKGGRVLKIYI
jgi:hypothetical protein